METNVTLKKHLIPPADTDSNNNEEGKDNGTDVTDNRTEAKNIRREKDSHADFKKRENDILQKHKKSVDAENE